jgi:predicted nucleic acid-binding protein
VALSRYCLDTSAYSHFQRGDPQVVELIDRAEWIGVPAVVLGELRVGFRLGTQRDRNERRLVAFLANPAVEVVSVDAEVSNHYADIVVDLRRRGTPLPTNDIWIAATGARSGAMLLSYDDHFEQISRVGTVLLTERDIPDPQQQIERRRPTPPGR